MSVTRRSRWRAAIVFVALLSAGIAAPSVIARYWRMRGDNLVQQGARLAHREGCLSCHLSSNGHEVADAGSKYGTIPSFRGGNLMMFASSDSGIARWIAEGSASSGRSPLIPMPAFRAKLSDSEIRAIARYVVAQDGIRIPNDGPVAVGRAASLRSGCESCHGVVGSGGEPNPHSFTGTVPGWLGADFGDLVRDRDEFEEWVREGRSRRLRANAVASYFLDRANLSMPRFGQSLSAEEIDGLWAYVQWLRDNLATRERAP